MSRVPPPDDETAIAGASTLIAALKDNSNRGTLAKNIVAFLERLPDADTHISALWWTAHNASTPFAAAVASSWRLTDEQRRASVKARRAGERAGATRNPDLTDDELWLLIDDSTSTVRYELAVVRGSILPYDHADVLSTCGDKETEAVMRYPKTREHQVRLRPDPAGPWTRARALRLLVDDLAGTNVPHESICAVLKAWFDAVDPTGWSRDVWDALHGRNDTPALLLLGAAVKMSGADPAVVEQATTDRLWRLRAAAMRRADVPTATLVAAVADRAAGVRLVAASHPSTPVESLESLLVAGTAEEKAAVAARPDLTDEMRAWAALDPTVPTRNGFAMLETA